MEDNVSQHLCKSQHRGAERRRLNLRFRRNGVVFNLAEVFSLVRVLEDTWDIYIQSSNVLWVWRRLMTVPWCLWEELQECEVTAVSLFVVFVGLCQGCPWVQFLFISSMDRIFWLSQWKDASGQTQDSLGRLNLSVGLETPQCLPSERLKRWPGREGLCSSFCSPDLDLDK